MKPVYNDYAYTKFPFGKYKGTYMKDISESYLKWAIFNIKDQGICEMCSIELQRRQPNLRKNKV